MSAVQDRLNRTLERADIVLDQRLRREKAALDAEAVEREHEAREQARADSFRCREIGEIYDEVFRSFGVTTPEPADGERPGRYRRRLFDRLRRRLPDSHDLADVRDDDLPPGPAFVNFEEMLLQAAKAEAERPSVDNLPSDGSMIERHRVDSDTGSKVTEFFGRRSFIADLGRPGRRVRAIRNPHDNTIIWGQPLPQAR